MKYPGIITLIIASFLLSSCLKVQTAQEILNEIVESIDTIETIYYKQDMIRTNPRNVNETISRYREMYFTRLPQDSIVGVKGHWYFYDQDGRDVGTEDIYDGIRLVRKNNLKSLVRLYDLEKYPKFREKHFWSHNTLYSMQYTFKYMLSNSEMYKMERLNDTIFNNNKCFQIEILLENKSSRMPGFKTELEDSEGDFTKTILVIDQQSYYPLRFYEESYSMENPDQKYFIDQIYYDIEFNLVIDEAIQFDTSCESLQGFQVEEMNPK